jgi:transcriptional regulator with GAF, ATPase, and Fis domain
MNTPQVKSAPARELNGSGIRTPLPPLSTLPTFQLNQPTLKDARIASLKVLVMTLLSEIESLENQTDASDSHLNLQDAVHQFEATLIRVALKKTGGRQRRAARLLGTKVTTLNTKIKRYGILTDPLSDPARVESD